MSAFEVELPRTLEEALEAVDTLNDEGAKFFIKAGGTDLLVWIKKRAVAPEVLVDISKVAELGGVTHFPYRGLRIGAAATVSEVAAADVKGHYMAIYDSCMAHSDPLIRNKATVVGNVCSAVPSGDMLPALLAHGAEVHLASVNGTRKVLMEDYITGPRKSVKKNNEIVTHIWVPVPKGRTSGCYVKLGRRNSLDLAQVGVSCVIFEPACDCRREYRITCGAVAPKPVRVTEAEDTLRGMDSPSEGLIEKAAKSAMAAVSPISDVRASKEYRLSQVGELVARSIKICIERIGG